MSFEEDLFASMSGNSAPNSENFIAAATETPTLFYDDSTSSRGANSTLSPLETQEVIEVTDHLTDGQTIAISVLYIISGTLSIIGSSTIIYKVVRNRQKAKPYDRLMLGLSCCDIVASLSWILTPFLAPEDSSVRVWSSGTDGSCTFLGTLTQFGYAAIFYNLALSFYYLLTVRFKVKRQDFAKRYEPFLHVFGCLYFATTGITGAIMGVYSEMDVGLGCWVNDYPTGCINDGQQGATCKSPAIAWAFSAGPLLVTLLALIINNLVIYFHVKKTLGMNNDNNETGTSNGANTVSDTASIISSSNTNSTLTSKNLERQQQHKRHIREVATQGTLYVVTFFCAYTPLQILRAVEAYSSMPISEQPLFPLLLLNSILLPLQGFFNMFVYNRPNYTRIKLAYPELSPLEAIRKACLDSNIPKLTEASQMHSQSVARSRAASRMSANGGGGSSIGGPVARHNRNSRVSGMSFESDLDVLVEGSHEEETENNEILDDYKRQFNNLTMHYSDAEVGAADDYHDGSGSEDDGDEDAKTAELDDEPSDNDHDDGNINDIMNKASDNDNVDADNDDFDLEKEYSEVLKQQRQDKLRAAISSATSRNNDQQQQGRDAVVGRSGSHRIGFDGRVQ